MNHFVKLDQTTVLRSKGTFREVPLFVDANSTLYAARGQSFIRLYRGGRTSVANVFWNADQPISGTYEKGHLIYAKPESIPETA